MDHLRGWTMGQYIYFGGYPGVAINLEEDNESRFISYINDSLIETTISTDILLMTQVHKPIFLRRLFQLGCNYSGQIHSFTKMLAELHEKGNTITLAHYLDLLAGAGLVTGIQKYAPNLVRQKTLSPKLLVYNTALMTAQSFKSFNEARQDQAFWGDLVESACGAYLLNVIRGTQVELFYWREDNREVDFILKKGDNITPLKIKSGNEVISSCGLDTFVKKLQAKTTLLVGSHGMPLEEFFKAPISALV